MNRLLSLIVSAALLTACDAPPDSGPGPGPGPSPVGDMASQPPPPAGDGAVFAFVEVDQRGVITRQFHRDGAQIGVERFMMGVYELKIPGAEGGGAQITPISDAPSVICRRMASFLPRLIVGCASAGVSLDSGFFLTYVR